MKLTIDKHITIGDAVFAQKILKDFKSGDNMESLDKTELERAAAFYLREYEAKVYEVKAEIAYHNGEIGLLTDEENAQTRYPLDIYIELFAKGRNTCGEIAFYLTNFWSLSSENSEEIINKAYCKLYKREK